MDATGCLVVRNKAEIVDGKEAAVRVGFSQLPSQWDFKLDGRTL